jgi:hypothetical protein
MGGMMKSGRFNPDVNGPIRVRGDRDASGGILDWDSTKIFLHREEYNIYKGSFWAGVCYIPRNLIQAGQKLKYKFFIERDSQNRWENNVADRKLIYTTSLIEQRNDTTLHWVYFDDFTLTDVKDQSPAHPSLFSLQQNYPNPFNTITIVSYQLPVFSNLSLVIYGIGGRKVRTFVNTQQQAGNYQIVWDGTDEHNLPVAAGVYFYRMEAGDPSTSSPNKSGQAGQVFVKLIKLVLVK